MNHQVSGITRTKTTTKKIKNKKLAEEDIKPQNEQFITLKQTWTAMDHLHYKHARRSKESVTKKKKE